MERSVPAFGPAVMLCCLVASLAVGDKLWAQEEEMVPRPATFLELVRPQNPKDSERYAEVISELIRITLHDGGLQTVEPVGEAVEESPEELLEWARAEGADYLITALYREDAGQVAVRFELLEVVPERVVAVRTRTRKVDLSFDRIVTEAVGELLGEVGEGLVRYEARATTVAREGVAAAITAPAPSGPREGPGVQAGAAAASRAPPRFRHLELAVGVAPFLPVGKVSDYFKVGLFCALSVLVRFDLGVASLGTGVEAGSSLFEAQGASDSAQTILAPLGGIVMLTLSYGTPLEVTVRASGGVALLSMAPDSLGLRLNKMLPYASAGVGLNLGLGPAFALAVDTRFCVYFEQAYGELSPLFGITPAVYLLVRV